MPTFAPLDTFCADRARRAGPLIAAALGALLAVGSASADPPGATAPTDVDEQMSFGDELSVSWVLVPAVVRGVDGLATGLERDDFRLAVDGQPTPIASFDADRDVPFSLVVLQDLSGSMANGGKLEAGRRALDCVTQRASAHDQVALASFAAGRTEVEVPFTVERPVLAEAADRWRAWGTTALHDAVAWLPEIRLEARAGRVAALLVTDGRDNASRLDPETVRSMVRQAEVPVYVLALHGVVDDEIAEPSADDGPPAQRLLDRLAEATGGRLFTIHRAGDVTAACAQILGELRLGYTLGFEIATPAAGTARFGGSRWRAIEVEVDDPRLEVAHRSGYVGELPRSLRPH